METFEFDSNGGYTATLTDEELIIECKGIKGFLFFYRVKPRTTHIPLAQIVAIDVKSAGIRQGYGRFITPELEEYPSSSYMAMHDTNSIITDNDEEDELLHILIKKITKKHKHIPVNTKKS